MTLTHNLKSYIIDPDIADTKMAVTANMLKPVQLITIGRFVTSDNNIDIVRDNKISNLPNLSMK